MCDFREVTESAQNWALHFKEFEQPTRERLSKPFKDKLLWFPIHLNQRLSLEGKCRTQVLLI